MTQATLFDVSAGAAGERLPPGWHLAPDYRGRLGLERVDVRPWEAWWRRCDFEDLPESPPVESQ
jgi:hypothetical protein